MAAQSPPTQGSTPTQEEGTPPPPPVPTSEETTLKLRRLDQALNLLRPNAVTRWEPEPWDLSLAGPDGGGAIQSAAPHKHTNTHAPAHISTHAHKHTQAPAHAHTPITARQSRQEGIPPPPTTLTQEEGTLLPQLREKALVILRMDNIQLWDPEEEILSPTLAGIYTSPSASPSPATVSERQHCSPGAGRDPQPQSQVTPAPPASAPSPPPATVSERQHCSSGAGADRQPTTHTEMTTTPPAPPTLPSSFQPLLDAQPFVPGVP